MIRVGKMTILSSMRSHLSSKIMRSMYQSASHGLVVEHNVGVGRGEVDEVKRVDSFHGQDFSLLFDCF